MGTSQSYGGPGDLSKLLPSWALPPAEPPSSESPDMAEGPATETSDAVQSPVPDPTLQVWRAARQSLGKTVRAHSGARDYPRSASDYVRARGGARQATRSSRSGVVATTRLGGLLSAIARDGIAQATQEFGLGDLVGKSAIEVQATLMDVLAPHGSSLEEAAARRAVADTISQIYDEYGLNDGGLESLEKMSEDQIASAIVDSVGTYIYYRWTQELGLAIERNAISAAEAVEIEREMLAYIQNTIEFEFTEREVLDVDWGGREGRELIERIYLEAYSLIET